MARHGPMVLGVCRQLLRDPNDVEDAFQATFLVLVRKAGSLRRRDLLGNWLYGVAYRVALPGPGGRGASAARRAGRTSRRWRTIAATRARPSPSPGSTRRSAGSPRSTAPRSCSATWRV